MVMPQNDKNIILIINKIVETEQILIQLQKLMTWPDNNELKKMKLCRLALRNLSELKSWFDDLILREAIANEDTLKTKRQYEEIFNDITALFLKVKRFQQKPDGK
jgi:hypothetical protein